MKILILGFSSIAKRRVIPALEAIIGIESIDVACQRENIEIATSKPGKIFRSYQEALESSDADIVYISLVNSAHCQWVEQALIKGYHVVVDKPAFLSIADAETMAVIAEKQGKALIEANVFSFHPQVEECKKHFNDLNSEISRVYACFSFPPLDASNFRYSKEMGGGALYDLGPYALATGEVFFGQEPECIQASINRQSDKLDYSFSVLMSYSGGRSLVGHFGFDTSYQNRVSLISKDICVELDRVFTTPPDMSNTLKVQKGGKSNEYKIKAFDSFVEFFKVIISDIKSANYQSHTWRLLQAAKLQQRLIQSAWNFA